MRGLPRQRRPRLPGSRQHRNRHRPHDRSPPIPPRQLRQIIRPHQPDKPRTRKPPLQFRQRISSIARPQHPLDRRRQNPSPIRNRPRRAQPHRHRRHPGLRLQRIPRRYQQPHLIQPQRPHRRPRHMQMSRMRRVETPPQQPDPQPPPIAKSWQRLSNQGRTWPVPIT